MDPDDKARLAASRPRIPRVLGILNIVFAANLLVCGVCGGTYFTLVIPLAGKMTTRMQEQMTTRLEEKRKADLKVLDRDATKAKTDREKWEVEARRKEIASRKVAMPLGTDPNVVGFNEPKIRRFAWIEFLSGVALNLLLLASGIGLVQRRTWGLRLGIGVAAAKIVRLVLCYGYVIVGIAPTIALNLAQVAKKAMEQQQMPGVPAPPANMYDLFVKTYTIMITASSVTIILLGVIYPAVMLWLLTRPGAWLACSDRPRPLGPEESW